MEEIKIKKAEIIQMVKVDIEIKNENNPIYNRTVTEYWTLDGRKIITTDPLNKFSKIFT